MYDSALETIQHIRYVQYLMQLVIERLLTKAREHDRTKLESPEKEVMDQFTPRLKGMTYDSPEYRKCLEEMKETGFLKHHYGNSTHHPESFKGGIEGMGLIDLVEMLCDWVAAARRHDDGDPLVSLERNIKRFNIDPQLASILKNSITFFSYNG